MKRIQERGLPPMSTAQQTVLVGAVAEGLAVIGTIAFVETREPADRRQARREQYPTLAATVVAGACVGALILALNADSDGLVGNVG